MVKTSARADLFLMEKARVRVTAKMTAVFADRSSKGDAFMMSWIYLDYNWIYTRTAKFHIHVVYVLVICALIYCL